MYTKEEFEKMEKYIHHTRDENFTYAGLRQIVDKYLCQDRSSGEIYESPQHRILGGRKRPTSFCINLDNINLFSNYIT